MPELLSLSALTLSKVIILASLAARAGFSAKEVSDEMMEALKSKDPKAALDALEGIYDEEYRIQSERAKEE